MTKGFKFNVLTTIAAGVITGLFMVGLLGSSTAQATGGSGCACASGADCSAQSAKTVGATMPRVGCCQRSNASAAVTLPVAASILGW